MSDKRDRAIQWLETNLMSFVKECGGDVGNTMAHRTAVHLLSGIGHNHTDAVVKVAREKWDVKYSRARK
ncbi:MAG: hypothetical protein V3W44_02275 [Dehalococcoidales bacterium]